MISTVFKISVLRLCNNKQELLLVFVVPILFFSIFAMIFSRGVGSQVSQVNVSIVNDDNAAATQRLIAELLQREELECITGIGSTNPDWPILRLARALISHKRADVVIYFPAGFSESRPSEAPLPVQVLNEGSNPFSSQVVEAVLAQSLATHLPPVRLTESSERAPGNMRLASATLSSVDSTASLATLAPPLLESSNVFAANKHQPKIAMYAAGIAVMFLLFSASGAGASLLEEQEAGTLQRLLTSQLTMTELLVGKWLYMVTLGLVQISTMFLWGQVVFGVDLLGHLPGFLVMSLATTAASASFALFLASVCRSRNQLNGVAVILVLSMSALGGSMIPRYVMSESMRRLGQFTFNGWALDGFQKVFWYELPLSALKTEVAVLMAITAIFGLATSALAVRWSKA